MYVTRKGSRAFQTRFHSSFNKATLKWDLFLYFRKVSEVSETYIFIASMGENGNIETHQANTCLKLRIKALDTKLLW